MKNSLILVLVLFVCITFLKAQDFSKNAVFIFPKADAVGLTVEMKSYLDKAAEYLKEHPSAVLKVTGHSEAVMTTKQQEYISEARAQSVMIYMTNKDIAPARIMTEGAGASNPIYGFDEADKNNRIEIEIFIPGAKPNADPASEIQKAKHEAEKEHHDEHHVHPHHIAIFGGATTPADYFELDYTEPTAGIEYEYRLPFWNQVLGIGVFGEVIFADHLAYLGGGLLFAHPIGGLKIFAGGGVEAVDEEDGMHTESLIRGGAGYDFHFGQFSAGPLISVDYIHEHFYLVYGLSFGIGL